MSSSKTPVGSRKTDANSATPNLQQDALVDKLLPEPSADLPSGGVR
jgi:hypothetical protein